MQSQVRISTGVVWELVDGQAVVVHPGGDAAFVLNPTATRIWEELAGGADLPKIAGRLARACGRGPEWVQTRLGEFLCELGRLGLLEGLPRRVTAPAGGAAWDGVALQAPALLRFGLNWFTKRIRPYAGTGGQPWDEEPGPVPGPEPKPL